MAGWSPRAASSRRLGAFDTAMVVVSLVIGIGIFRTPAMVAGNAGTTVRVLPGVGAWAAWSACAARSRTPRSARACRARAG